MQTQQASSYINKKSDPTTKKNQVKLLFRNSNMKMHTMN